MNRAAYTSRRRFVQVVVLLAIITQCGSIDATQRKLSQRASTPVPLQRPSSTPATSLQPVALIIGGTGMIKMASGETPGVLASGEIYSPATGLSVRIDSMTTSRSHHSAVLLPNGSVLVTGGVNTLFIPLFSGPTIPWILASTDVFDQITAHFRAGANMTADRDNPSTTLLNDGKVLVVGGGTSSAELYDAATGKFSATESMTIERYGQTATLLTNGKVLIAGGGSSQAELYDPETGKFRLTGKMSENRIYHTAILLLDGRVLIAGGSPYARSSATDTTELYDPLSGTFKPGPKMQESRAGHTATRLANGQVLITGGHDDDSAEIYDPVAEQFIRTGNMSVSRFGHSATRWPDGRVLIAGGWNKNYQPLATTETYDLRTGEFSLGGNMTEPRADHTATLIWVRSPISWAPPTPAATPTLSSTSTQASPSPK
jgi:WD40 repeat protein